MIDNRELGQSFCANFVCFFPENFSKNVLSMFNFFEAASDLMW